MAKHNIRIEPGDIVTPANFLTLVGLFLTIYGSIRITSGIGVFALLTGRLLDLFDGPLARATHTSRFGAFMDATGDKLAILALLIASWRYDIAPLWVIGYILAYNVVSALISIATELKGGEPVATKAGKFAVFLQSAALIWYAIASLTDETAITVFALVISVLGLILSVGALEGYAARFIKARKDT